MVDIELAAALSIFLNDILSLFFGTDKQNFAAVRRNLAGSSQRVYSMG